MGKIIRYLGCLLVVLTLGAMSVTPVMAQAEPDLEPTQFEIANSYAGATNSVTVVVANNENVAVGSFDVKLEVDDGGGYVEVDTITGNSILASGDAWYWPVSVKFDWAPPAAGSYTLRATVDSDEAVAETAEGNNQIEQAVTVLASDPVTVKVRVEGETATIWSGEVTFFTSTITDKYSDTYDIDHPTAIGAIHAASVAGGFNIVLDSMFGPVDYVEEIEGEVPQGWDGWMFRVNWESSNIGAADYGLADGDEVLWYYAAWGAQPLKLTVDNNNLESPGTFTVTVESLDDFTSTWSALEDAIVYIDSHTYTTDADGEVKDIALPPGGYTVYADKGDYTQYTRSNQEMVIIYLPLNLEAGWNFISVPKRLANGYGTAQQLFGDVDTAGHSIFLYDATNGWTAMDEDAAVSPLEGIWIYAAADTELHPVFDTNPRQVPPTKELFAGWNAIGFSDFTDASANSTLTSVEDKWAVLMGFVATTQVYEESIINNAPDSDPHAETRLMSCWKGFWLYMTSSGELAGISS